MAMAFVEHKNSEVAGSTLLSQGAAKTEKRKHTYAKFGCK